MFSPSQQADVAKQWNELETRAKALHGQLGKKLRALTFRHGAKGRRHELRQWLRFLEQHLSQLRALRDTPQAWDITRPPAGEAALQSWLEAIAAQLRRCGRDETVRGNAWQFAAQLARNLHDVREWHSFVLQNSEFPQDEAALDDVDATVFRPYFAVSWDEVGPAECSTETREMLQLATVAIGNLRGLVRQALSDKYGLRAMPIVPKQTRFDARLHETNALLTLDCERAEQDNVIFSVENAGYELRGVVLRRALVRRWQWTGGNVEKTDDSDDNGDVRDEAAADETPNEDWLEIMKKGI